MTKIENIEDVAKRLKGLREALEMSAEEVANVCGIDCDTYRAYENCEADIPVSFVRTLAHKFGVELPAILFGEEPKMSSYFVTRCGNGVSVERSKAYSYQALAAGFSNKVINPYMVTVEPSEQPDESPMLTPIPNDGTSWATAEKVESARPAMNLFAVSAMSVPAANAAPAGAVDFEDYITSMTVEKLEVWRISTA